MRIENLEEEILTFMAKKFGDLSRARCTVIECCEECDCFTKYPFPVCSKLNKIIERKEGEKFDPECRKDPFSLWGEIWRRNKKFFS